MILSVRRTEVFRDATLGVMQCGSDTFFCVEHTLLSGRPLQASRCGQYALNVDVRGLWFDDEQGRKVRVQGGHDIRKYREPVVLVGANLRENRLYDTAMAMDRLMLLIASSKTLHQFQIELLDPEEMRYGEAGGKPWQAQWD